MLCGIQMNTYIRAAGKKKEKEKEKERTRERGKKRNREIQSPYI